MARAKRKSKNKRKTYSANGKSVRQNVTNNAGTRSAGRSIRDICVDAPSGLSNSDDVPYRLLPKTLRKYNFE